MTVRAETAQITVLNNLVGGQWRPPNGRQLDDVPNPATGRVLAQVRDSSAADVEAAVDAAGQAYVFWRATPPVDRSRVMFRFRDVLEQHLDELALLVTEENGKTLDEARGEVRRGIEVVEFACGIPTLMMGSVLEEVARDIDTELVRIPVGVVAGICPFNFPAMIPLWMVPLAVASGNTFVLKPSERTPRTAMRLVGLLHEAGAPPGVINLVHGAKDTVDALIAHPGIAAVSFVGSPAAARHVYRLAAAQGKRVQSLGGAKNHVVVMPDADLEHAVPAIIASAFGNAGERCLAGSVVEAVGEVADELVARLARAAAGILVGDGTDPGVEMGPVIRKAHRGRIVEYIEQGIRDGAPCLRWTRCLSVSERGRLLHRCHGV
jgi:malonate-semialdehyde dehydrogenase (acetylating)/methylmalonate-semialdehyde dehydrogenase